MPKANWKDRTGERHGMVTLIEYRNNCIWLAKCDCGAETLINTNRLGPGHLGTVSCGCARRKHQENYKTMLASRFKGGY